jgi:cyanophycin synthetase
MADYSKAKRIAYVTQNPKHELVREHIRAGGAACVLEEGINGQMITLYDKGSHIPLLWTHLIPATLEGKALFNVQNAMFAALIAWVMDIKVDNIRVGLRTFDTTFFQAPGRLNVYSELPFKVILDYGHNPAAVAAMAETVKRMEVGGRRLCVLAAPGDRRNEDIHAIALAAAGAFDHFIIRRDDDLRGRKPSEVTDLLRAGLLEGGVSASAITTIEDEQQAVSAALGLGQRGDLLVIFGDDITRCWKQIIRFGGGSETGEAPRPKPVNRIGTLAGNNPGPAREEPVEEVEPVRDDRPRASGQRKELIVDERGVRLAREEGD